MEIVNIATQDFGIEIVRKAVKQVVSSAIYILEFVAPAFQDYGVKTVQIHAIIVVADIVAFRTEYAKNVRMDIGVNCVNMIVMLLVVAIHIVKKTLGIVNDANLIIGATSVTALATLVVALAGPHVLKLQGHDALHVLELNGGIDVKKTARKIV